MKQNNQKRKAALVAKSKAESLKFQTMWGARQKMGEVTADVSYISLPMPGNCAPCPGNTKAFFIVFFFLLFYIVFKIYSLQR